MKSHISATIEKNLLHETDRFGREEKRSRSQVIEMALEQFLQERAALSDDIVTSAGCFTGKFSRAETYER